MRPPVDAPPEPERTIFERDNDGSGQVYYQGRPESLREAVCRRRLLREQREGRLRQWEGRLRSEPVSLQHICLRVMAKDLRVRAVDADQVNEMFQSMGPDVCESEEYLPIRRRLEDLLQTQQRKKDAEQAELREQAETKRRQETVVQQERLEEAEAEAFEWRRLKDSEERAAREAARRAQELEALRKASPASATLSQVLRAAAAAAATPAQSQRSAPPKRPLTANPFAAQQPLSKRPAPLPKAFHCPEPAIEPAPATSRPTPRGAPTASRAGSAAARGKQSVRKGKQRVPWSAREERALRDALQQGMHGKWEEILLRPEWCDVLSRRTGENLKDKARNLK